MTTQIKRRRGTTTEHNSFTGAEGEITIDTTKDTAVVHDGSTAGGHPLAKEDGSTLTNVNIDSGTIDGTTIGGASAGAGTFTNLTATGTTTLAGASTSADITFGDNDKAIFGAGPDLQIYHDGSNSFVQDVGTGSLLLCGNNLALKNGDNTESYIVCANNGATTIYHDNAPKLATTATGINVTGTVTFNGGTTSADLNFGDNDKAIFGAGSDLQIYHDGTNSFALNTVGELIIRNSSDDKDIFIQTDDGSGSTTTYIQADGNNGSVNLRHYGDVKLATTSTGIDVTGTVVADGLTVDGDATFGDGTLSIVDQGTLGLQIQHFSNNNTTIDNADSGDIFFRSGGTNFLKIDNTGDISFYEDTGTTPKLFWDASAESLGIGTTTVGQKLVVSRLGGDPVAIPSLDANTAALFHSGNGATGSGAALVLLGGNASACSLTFADTDNGYAGRISYSHSADEMIFRVNNADCMRIDSSGHLIVPNGVTLGTAVGTYSAANTLDDYEEGTFTPEYGGTTSNPTITHDLQFGQYVKIGQMVYFQIFIGTDSVSGGSGDLVVKNLPFTVLTGNAVHIGQNYSFATALGGFAVATGSTNYIKFYPTNSPTENTVAVLGTTTNNNRLNIAGCYLTT